MQKFVFALALAIALVAMVSGTVTMNFVQNDLMVDAPAQLRFTVTDEKLDNMSFTPSLTTAEQGQTPKPSPWKIASGPKFRSFFPLFGFDSSINVGVNQLPCVNTLTQQRIGILDFTSGSSGKFTFKIDDSSSWNEEYKSGSWGTWDITCIVYVEKPTSGPTSTNVVYLAGDKVTGDEKDIQLAAPSNGWVTPSITIDSVSSKHTGDWNDYGVGHIDFEFKVNTIGVYKVTGEDGPIIGNEFHPQGTQPSWYCSISGNEKFARITYGNDGASIYVPSVPSAAIKCSVVTTFGPTGGDHELKIALSDDFSTTKKITDYEVKNESARSYASFQDAEKSRFTIQMSFHSFEGFDKDSEIEIDFSSYIDVSDLSIGDSYSNFRGCNIKIEAKIESLKNRLKLKHPEFSKDLSVYERSQLECSFDFRSGSTIFDWMFIKNAYYYAKINDEKVYNHFNPSSTKIRINGVVNFEFESETADEDNKSDSIEVSHKFELKDKHKEHRVPFQRPAILFAFSDPTIVPTTVEKYGDYISCDAKGDGSYEKIELEFNKETFVWRYNLEEIYGDDEADMKFRCRHVVPKYNKYGLDLTPRLSLQAMVVDFNKEDVAYTSYAASSTMKPIVQPSSRPSNAEIPTDLKSMVWISQSFNVPTNVDYSLDTMSKKSTDFITTIKPILSEVETNWTFEGEATNFAIKVDKANDAFYTDFENGPKFNKWAADVSGIKGPHDGAVGFGHVTSYQSSQSVYELPSMQVNFQFLQPSTQKASISTVIGIEPELYVKQLDLKRSTDYVPVSDVRQSQLYVTQTTKCGAVDGYMVFGASKDTDFGSWSSLITAEKQTNLCPIGAACTVNNDCAQPFPTLGASLCENSKCTFKPRVESPYKYWNSSPTPFVSAVIAIIAFACLFF